MKWHIVSKESAPFDCNSFCYISKQLGENFVSKFEEAHRSNKNLTYQSYISHDIDIQNDLLESFDDYYWEEEREAIDNLFVIPDIGEFDWEEECTRYYNHFEAMVSYLKCLLESDSGIVLADFDIEFSYDFKIENNKI